MSIEPGLQAVRLERLTAKDDQTEFNVVVIFACVVYLHQLQEGRRSLVKHRNFFVGKQAVKVLWGATDPIRDNHQPCAVQQRTPQFPDRKIEPVGMEQGPDIMLIEVE